ncbi:MAG: methyltransferase domain-containing protein [Proteobacteria bacterium]|nr:methyltransferase domain-containing protein [Pseudomonadota bacterium]MBI3497879.1 methyltransferase domain-containing protein [Pseudomonadota bacterium]
MADDDRKFFNDGAAYEQLMGRWSRRAGALFLDWLAVGKGMRWLDVGCGNGAFTEVMIAKAAPGEVRGIDPSEAQIDYARGRAESKPAEFQVGDAEALPFADAAFDVAVMALVITFVPNPGKAVGEMVRVVKPGGLVATYMWDILGGAFPLEPMRAGLLAIGIDAPRSPGAEVSQKAELNRLWTEAGLEAVETREIAIEVAFRDFDEFWDSNMALATPIVQKVRALSPADLERLKAILRQRLLKGADGRISFPARANAVKGRVPQ